MQLIQVRLETFSFFFFLHIETYGFEIPKMAQIENYMRIFFDGKCPRYVSYLLWFQLVFPVK